MTTHDKRWDGLTITGDLAIGVYYAGSRHKTFTLRVPVAGDLIAAQQAHPQGPMQLITLNVYRQQLLALGEIPQEALTVELLRAELAETDLMIIARADEDLEKARAAERGITDWRRVEHALVKHGYRLEEIRHMTRAEIDARVDLLIGRKAGTTRYVSQRKRKSR